MSKAQTLKTVSSASVLDLLSACRDRDVLSDAQLQALDLGDLNLGELGLVGPSTTALPPEAVDPLQRIPEQTLITLWQALSGLSAFNKDGFGLAVGQRINPKAKGLLANWVSQTATLHEALDVFCHNISLMNPSENWQIRQDGKACTLVFSLGEAKEYPSVAVERSMSAMLAWGRALSGQDAPVLAAEFSFERPEYTPLFEQMFGTSISFSAKQNSLSVSSEYLQLPVLSSNHFLKSMLEEQAALLLSRLGERASIIDKVNALINDALVAGHVLSITQTCQALSVSRQTLYRHLKQEKHTFKSLLEHARKVYGLNLLQDKQRSIGAVAIQLGYADTSSFNKAFKRWYGLPPQAYLMRKSSRG